MGVGVCGIGVRSSRGAHTQAYRVNSQGELTRWWARLQFLLAYFRAPSNAVNFCGGSQLFFP